MPVQVDIEERRHAIAEATQRVARRHGIRGVTMRSVAEELRASTSVVTHYVPTRAALLANAIDHYSAGRRQHLEQRLAGCSGEQATRLLCRTLLFPPPGERVYDALWLELLADPERQPEVGASLQRHARWLRGRLAVSLAAGGTVDPEASAETLYLILAGAALARSEDPETWTDSRLEQLLDRLLATQLGASPIPEPALS